jgi:hypothetical protein
MSLGDTVVFNLEGYTSAHLVILSGSFNGWNTAELANDANKNRLANSLCTRPRKL